MHWWAGLSFGTAPERGGGVSGLPHSGSFLDARMLWSPMTRSTSWARGLGGGTLAAKPESPSSIPRSGKWGPEPYG